MNAGTKKSDRPSDLKLPKSLKSFFEERRDILLVFVFGSFVHNRLRPSSDLDIGVLFEAVPEIGMVGALAEELSSTFRREVDLVVLNHASPVLRMQMLKHGMSIYSRSKKHFHRFFTDTVNQYDDLKRIRKNCEESILRGRIYAG